MHEELKLLWELFVLRIELVSCDVKRSDDILEQFESLILFSFEKIIFGHDFDSNRKWIQIENVFHQNHPNFKLINFQVFV